MPGTPLGFRAVTRMQPLLTLYHRRHACFGGGSWTWQRPGVRFHVLLTRLSIWTYLSHEFQRLLSGPSVVDGVETVIPQSRSELCPLSGRYRHCFDPYVLLHVAIVQGLRMNYELPTPVVSWAARTVSGALLDIDRLLRIPPTRVSSR